MDLNKMNRRYAEVYRKAKACKEYEPVRGDFSLKVTGMDVLSRFVDLAGSDMALEIGCGSGFNAALLSLPCRRLIATDLPFHDARTHSLGISVARKLLSKLEIENVMLVSCSGESLPFPDGMFDFVFSSSVLEHIDDKERALKEMMRVVRPGGVVIFIIPTYVQSLCAFAHLYLYIAKRALDVARVKIFHLRAGDQGGLLPRANDSGRAAHEIAGSFRKSHPSFPLPEPHGAYKNIMVEFARQLPWNWIRLAKRCGASSVDTFAAFFLPFNIMEIFSTNAIAALYATTRSIHKILARSFLQYFSYSWCVVARK